MKQYILILLSVFISLNVKSQFKDIYPIGDNPSLLALPDSKGTTESIMFEANPILRLSFHNKIAELLIDSNSMTHAQAFYVSARPQLRMYSDNSVPVKMPSYRILLGLQHTWKRYNDDLFTVSLESGHYSNGQSGCTYSEKFKDDTPPCSAIHNAITDQSDLSSMLNRTNGEFSTNITELLFNYRLNTMLKNIRYPLSFHSFTAGTVLYHDDMFCLLPVGGYSDNAIDIYGRWRLIGKYEYNRNIKPYRERSELRGISLDFFSLSLFGEYITNTHPSVQPLRLEGSAQVFFYGGYGFKFGVAYGHDNYNIRMVDSRFQSQLGLVWNMFPIREMKIKKSIKGENKRRLKETKRNNRQR